MYKKLKQFNGKKTNNLTWAKDIDIYPKKT